MSLYLIHHGVKGQNWGERKYQYEDGSLTPEGRIHYGVGDGDDRKSGYSVKKKSNHQIRLEKKYRDKGFSEEESEQMAKSRIKKQKIAVGVTAGVVAAAAATAGYLYLTKDKRAFNRNLKELENDSMLENGKNLLEGRGAEYRAALQYKLSDLNLDDYNKAIKEGGASTNFAFDDAAIEVQRAKRQASGAAKGLGVLSRENRQAYADAAARLHRADTSVSYEKNVVAANELAKKLSGGKETTFTGFDQKILDAENRRQEEWRQRNR